MKKSVFTFIFMACVVNGIAQSNLKIGFLDFNALLQEMPGIENAKSDLLQYQKLLNDKMDALKAEFQNKYADYQSNSSGMSDLIKQVKEKELTNLQDTINAFTQKASLQLEAKQRELISPIIEKARTVLNDVAKQHGYNCIINLLEDVILYKSDALDDVKQTVLAAIGNKPISVNSNRPSLVNKIGYIDINSVISLMPGIETAKTDLQKHSQKLNDQLDAMKTDIATRYQDYQSNVSGMSELIKQTKEKEIIDLQERIDAFGSSANQELQAKQTELLQPFIDRCKRAIQESALENGFSVIFNNLPELFIYNSAHVYDISDRVKAKLNINVSNATITDFFPSDYRLGFVKFDTILEQTAEVRAARNELKKYQQKIDDQLVSMKADLDARYTEYQSQSVLWSSLIKQTKERELTDLQTRFSKYEEQSKDDYESKKVELMTPLIQKLRNRIGELCKENNIDIAFNNMEDVLLFTDNRLVDLSLPLKGKPLPVNSQMASQPAVVKKGMLPPMISIEEISFSTNILNAGEAGTLSITIKNTGMGDANGVTVALKGGLPGLSFARESTVPTIKKEGGIQKIVIEIKAGIEIPTSDASFVVDIIEPNFKIKISGKQLSFKVMEAAKPELILAKLAVLENRSTNPNNQIDINEQIGLKFAIQNIGQGEAKDVKVSVINNQSGVIFLGIEDQNGNMVSQSPFFPSILSGNFESVTYCYFVNSEFSNNELTFSVQASEKYGKFGFSQTKSVPINKNIREEGYIRTIATNVPKANTEKITIRDIPDFEVDVDVNIPVNPVPSPNTFAVIIGNENYANEIVVSYAKNDAFTFKQYAVKTLGIPEKNIRFLQDATYGQMINVIDWITSVIKAYEGQARVLFYYAGHGMPDYVSKTAYLLPVDGNSTNVKTAIKMEELYTRLAEFPSKSVTLFLDACFSGASRDGMLAEGRGVKIKPKEETLQGNMIVFSATTGDETAYPLKEMKHGLFTYYVLKKLQESKGKSSYKELYDYIRKNVNQQSIIVNNKSQNPQVNCSPGSQASWELWKICY